MKHLKQIIPAVLVTLILSWAFFRFFYYPVEIERHTNGAYTLVVYAAPGEFSFRPTALFREILIACGTIRNNTQIRVDLLRDGKKIKSMVMARQPGLYRDYLPLSISWSKSCVSITNLRSRNVIMMSFQKSGSENTSAPPRQD